MPTNSPKIDDGAKGEEKLRECPHCGLAVQVYQDEEDRFYISCDECDCETAHFGFRDRLISFWNMRTDSRPIAMPTNETSERLKEAEGLLTSIKNNYWVVSQDAREKLNSLLARIGSAQSAGSGKEGEGRET